MQAGWLPASKLQDAIDKVNAEIGSVPDLEKEARKADEKANLFECSPR